MYNRRRNKINHILRPLSPVVGNHLTDENQSKLPINLAKKR